MQIVLNPKIKSALITVAVVLLVMITALTVRRLFFSVAAPVANMPAADQQAAVVGVTAFYTLDYTESPDSWSERVCVYSTTKGCEIVKRYFAPQILAMVEKHRIQTGSHAEIIRLVENKGDTETWQVQVTMDNPWEGIESASQVVYVEVSQEQGQWLMNRILFVQEVPRLRHSSGEAQDD